MKLHNIAAFENSEQLCDVSLLFVCWSGIILVQMLLGLLSAVIPWQVALLLLATLILFIMFLVKPDWAIYPLIFVVPISANMLGIFFYTDWSNIRIDILPIFSPLVLMGFCGLVLKRVAGLQKQFSGEPLVYLYMVFFLWACFTLFWAPCGGKALLQLFILFFQLLLFIYILNFLAEDKKHHRRVMWCWIIFGLLVAEGNVIVRHLPNVAYSVDLAEFIKFEAYVRNLEINLRSRTIGNANLTAATLNMVFPILFCFLVFEKNILKKLFFSGLMFLLLWGFFLNMSKGATLAAIVQTFFLFLVFRKTRGIFLRGTVFFLIGFILLYFIQDAYLALGRPARLVYDITGQSVSLLSRLVMWRDGMAALLKYTVGFGLGPGGFSYLTNNSYAHSIYFSILFDYGIFGIMIFLAACLTTLKRFFTVFFKFEDGYYKNMFLAFCAGLLATGLHGILDHHYNAPVLTLYLAMATATYRLAIKEHENSPAAGQTS
ncbi:MAG: O-antigen ligase domain-containing protein [Candidatus Electrothrix sp. MAN1_4]|nr:O-antigen ligase domain-containing protein [Candidatus Electrothrix sp. MAN1_4]